MRTLSLISVLAALGIVTYLFVQRSGGDEPQGNRVEAAEAAASSGVAAANLQSAAVSLEAARTTSGTYAGARLEDLGVRLVRADAASYCVETGAGAAVTHLRGPRGTPAPGPCG